MSEEKFESKQKQPISDLWFRKGTIRISTALLHEASEPILKALFSEFYPFGIESLWTPKNMGNYHVYHGLSPHFETIQDGVEAPEYDVVMTITEKNITVAFKKVDHHILDSIKAEKNG